MLTKRPEGFVQLEIAGCENLDAHQQTSCSVYIK